MLIIGYEALRSVADELRGADGLVVCDEGHRLKNSKGNRTIAALKRVVSAAHCRRILLTGTPVQNNLSELFAMCDFVNPRRLGELRAFQHTSSGRATPTALRRIRRRATSAAPSCTA